jgi:recombinational DNA repair ATPase RecF
MSAKRKATFLRELACHGVVTVAARAASPGAKDSARATFYEEREADPKFAADWDAALEQANAALELEMHRRAVLGYEEQQLDDTGAVVRSFRKYSDNLLLALARKRIAGFATTTANVQLSGDLRSTVAVDGASLAEAVRKVAADLRRGLQQLAASERNRLAEDVAACG